MEGTSSVRRDLQLHSPRTGCSGSACCILFLVCRIKVCSSENQLLSGGVGGVACDCEWCSVGALLRFVLQSLGSWKIFRSSSGFPDVRRLMAATPELALVTAGVEDVIVRAEASEPQELAMGNVFDYMVGVTGSVM